MLRKGDPFPPPGVVYSYADDEAKRDFEARWEAIREAERKERAARVKADCDSGG